MTVLVLTIAAVALGPVLFVFFSAIAMVQTVMLRQILLHVAKQARWPSESHS